MAGMTIDADENFWASVTEMLVFPSLVLRPGQSMAGMTIDEMGARQ